MTEVNTPPPTKPTPKRSASTSTTTQVAARKATARKATARKATARKATAKTTTPQGAAQSVQTGKATKKATTKSLTGRAATTKTATASTRAARAPAGASRSSSAQRSFAAGAARASGERRRRSGTPLLSPNDAVDVPPAPDALPPVPTPVRDAGSEPATLATPPVSATSTRPSRADIAQARAKRAKRLATAGSTARLRSVPSLDDAGATDPAEARAGGAASPPEDRPAFSTEFTTDLAGASAELAATPAASGVSVALQSRAERLVGAVLEAAELNSEARPGPAEIVDLAVNVLRAAASSAGVPTDAVERQVADTLAYLRRRLSGDYVVDEFGFDEDYTLNVHLPVLRPFYRTWFRVETRGVENIPDVGGALLVANHSGTIALDSLMTQVAVYDEHPKRRHLRMLGADLVFQTPFVGTMARRSGTTLAANSDAQRLLSGGELVGVWPEGFKGIGKPFTERYKLQRFGRGGFVAAALRAGVPIIPVSIVGAEEIYPIIGDMPAVARLLGMPYAPVTPTWPLLGPLGLIPLPSKWLIEFGPPIETSTFGPDAADDPMLVFDLTDQVRETIQQTLYSLLMQRKSVFF